MTHIHHLFIACHVVTIINHVGVHHVVIDLHCIICVHNIGLMINCILNVHFNLGTHWAPSACHIINVWLCY
jgi:hypothetical protein